VAAAEPCAFPDQSTSTFCTMSEKQPTLGLPGTVDNLPHTLFHSDCCGGGTVDSTHCNHQGLCRTGWGVGRQLNVQL
jgi:hypothetical protein